MSDVSRRNALKLTTTALVGGAAALLANEVAGADAKPATGEDRWKGHEIADPKALQKQTKPFRVAVGVDPSGTAQAPSAEAVKEFAASFNPMGQHPHVEFWGSPRPDLNGLRVKLPNQPAIYLIDRGYRRWIPNPATYNNLFRDWNGVIVDIDINEIPVASPITSGAILARPDGAAPVYLVDNGVKRWITSPAIMDKYYFAWNRVYVLPPASVDSIPVGSNIDS